MLQVIITNEPEKVSFKRPAPLPLAVVPPTPKRCRHTIEWATPGEVMWLVFETTPSICCMHALMNTTTDTLSLCYIVLSLLPHFIRAQPCSFIYIVQRLAWGLPRDLFPSTLPWCLSEFPSLSPHVLFITISSGVSYFPMCFTIQYAVFCLGLFCRARRPAPFWWCHALF